MRKPPIPIAQQATAALTSLASRSVSGAADLPLMSGAKVKGPRPGELRSLAIQVLRAFAAQEEAALRG